MNKEKKLPELAPGEKLLGLYVSSCEPDGNWDNPGHWSIYYHCIILKVPASAEIPGAEDPLVFSDLESGNFEIIGEIWCDELEEVLSKDSIAKISKKSGKNMDEFIKTLQREVYFACLGYYRDNFEVEDEDAWNGDGINHEALYEIIHNYGGSGISEDPEEEF
jgi:hypothetical protein